jgi:putative ABC transport system permease protein
MGDFMGLFDVFGVIMFVLLMYLLSKQIIEKNAQSISMVKILGFSDAEIGRLYIVATSFVVIVSLLVAVPLTDGILRWAFHSYLYTEVTGYIPYIISKNCFVFMILMGLACYALVSLLQLAKIRRIPKSDALKNVE